MLIVLNYKMLQVSDLDKLQFISELGGSKMYETQANWGRRVPASAVQMS